MSDFHFNRVHATAVAKFLGEKIPADLELMYERRKAVALTELVIPAPDVTELDPQKIPGVLQGVALGSEDTFARMRTAVTNKIDRAYAAQVKAYGRESFPRIAAVFNTAAEAFVGAYDPQRLPQIDPALLEPAGLSVDDFTLWRTATDARTTMDAAVELLLKHVLPQTVGRASWHRQLALVLDFSSYEEAYTLASQDNLNGKGLSMFGIYGVAMRENYRGNGPYVLRMPETISDYEAQMTLLDVDPKD